MDSDALVELVTAAVDDLKGQDVQVLDVRELTTITDYMVIVSGTSDRHLKALAEEVVRMRAAIARLPKSYRVVVEEMDLAEVPVQEMAARLGKSAGAVHMLRSRAHDRLRELLARDATR